MGKEQEAELFARNASGLVREVSTSRALFFNWGNGIGLLAALSITLFILFPLDTSYGIPLYTWVLIFVGGYSILYAICFAFLASIMPRTGGDYVFTSRIMHPMLGWIEGLMTVIANFSIGGFNIFFAAAGIGYIFYEGGATSNGAQYIAIGQSLTSSNAELVIGVLLVVFAGVLVALPTRHYHNINSIMVGVALLMAIPIAYAVLSVDPPTFASNFAKFSGTTMQQFQTNASNAGFSLAVNPLTLGTLAALLLWGATISYGYNFAGYLAGELKGRVWRTLSISFVGGLAGALFFAAIYPLIFYNKLGYSFLNGWAWTASYNSTVSPHGLAPSTNLLAAIARPDLFPLLFVAGFFFQVILNFFILPNYILQGSRILFAQSMDRMLPRKLAYVSERTHTPLYLILISTIGLFISFFAIYLGVSPAATLWFGLLMGLPVYAFPAINVLLLPFKRKDLYQLASPFWKRRIVGIPVPAVIGILWIVYFIPNYFIAVISPILQTISGQSPTQIIAYTSSTGVLFVIAVIFLGVITYYLNKAYHKRKGLDVDLIFKTIPPE